MINPVSIITELFSNIIAGLHYLEFTVVEEHLVFQTILPLHSSAYGEDDVNIHMILMSYPLVVTKIIHIIGQLNNIYFQGFGK